MRLLCRYRPTTLSLMTRSPAPGRSLVIPMFREEGRIGATIRAIAASPLNDPSTELLFVDDGSRDNTAEVTEKELADRDLNATVLRLERNLGKGAAVRAGVLASVGSAVAFADADLSADIPDIVRCFEAIEDGVAQVVLATREHEASLIVERQPLLRQLGGKTFNLILRALQLTQFRDTQCGLKSFRREVARELFEGLRIQGFAFDVEILFRAQQHGFSIREIPVQWRHVEESRVRTVSDSFRMARDALGVRMTASVDRRREERSVGATEMSEATFDVMARLEREHWWFRAKRQLVSQELRSIGAHQGLAVDVGCGTGEMVRSLSDLGFDAVLGTDLSQYALRLAAQSAEGSARYAVTPAERLPFSDGSVSCITSLDVVEHLVDDHAAVREFARVLQPGGVMVLAVPAYRWAWSAHDDALGHKRRYVADALVRLATAEGFRVRRCTYYHSWLVPLAYLLRKTPLSRLVRSSAEEASYANPIVNAVLLGVTRLERLLTSLVDLPFGLSILLVAVAPDPWAFTAALTSAGSRRREVRT